MAGRIYCGDNLEILSLPEFFQPEMVDLVYADPPFNSQRTYNIVYKGSNAQDEAFKDFWTWTEAAPMYARLMSDSTLLPRTLKPLLEALHDRLVEEDDDLLAYLTMMTPRLVAMHRVLKRTGSLYLHCDPTASHYLKIVLDAIFGSKNFLNEVVWKRTFAHGSAKRFGPVHDVLFLYAKSDSYTWTDPRVDQDPDYVEKHFKLDDGDGRLYQAITLTGSGIRHGQSGKPWRGVDPTKAGRHWALPGDVVKDLGISGSVSERLDALDAAGMIYWPDKEDPTPRLKWYADVLKRVALLDVWTDIAPISAKAAERTGYPTQKPLSLLDRVIRASSREGDIVLDPFCGCGTSIEASERLGRRWYGIDIARKAVDVIEDRFRRATLDEPEIVWHPADKDAAYALAHADKHGFERWALRKIRAARVRARDRGIDGEALFKDGNASYHAIVSVKAGGVKPGDVRDLRGTMDREHAPIGVFVTRNEPSEEMKREAVRLGFLDAQDAEGPIPRIQFVNVERMFSPLPAIRCPGKNVTEMPKPTIPPPPVVGEQLALGIDQKVRDAAVPKMKLRSTKPKMQPAKAYPGPKGIEGRAVANSRSSSKPPPSSRR